MIFHLHLHALEDLNEASCLMYLDKKEKKLEKGLTQNGAGSVLIIVPIPCLKMKSLNVMRKDTALMIVYLVKYHLSASLEIQQVAE